MQNQNNNALKLIIITPDNSPLNVECDSLHLTAAAGIKDKGGLYGIRPGHTDAVILLENGPITAYKSGNMIESFLCSGGFARVKDNTVTVTAENIEITKRG